jgi:hypothetical protein
LAQEADIDPRIRCLARPLTTAGPLSNAALRAVDPAPISRIGQDARGLNV